MQLKRLGLLCAAVLLVLAPVWAGEGTIADGKVNITVFFEYDEQDFDSWKPAFNEASRLLWRATDGRLRFGEIRFTKCPSARDRADFRIADGSGRALAEGGVPGLGQANRYVKMFKDNKNDAKTVLHEFGHYGLGLYDEYKGQKWQWVAGADGNFTWQQQMSGASPWFDYTGDPALDPWYCGSSAEANGAGACIMDFADGWKPSRANFCLEGAHDGHHVTGTQVGANYFRTDQQVLKQHSCWTDVAAIAGGAVPGAAPNNTTNPPEDPTYKVLAENAFVVCIDRSGSMSGDRIANAILGGILSVLLAQEPVAGPPSVPGDRLGVTSFASSASTNFAIAEMTTANKNGAIAAINALIASGSTAIGDGLRQSLNDLQADEASRAGQIDEYCSKTVVLLSDGQNNSGESPTGAILNDLRTNRVKVNVVALGAGADQATLQAIASATGGSFGFVARQTQSVNARTGGIFLQAGEDTLPGVMASQFNEARGGNELALLRGDINPGETLPRDVLVDGFNESATFLLISGNAAEPLGLGLIPPGGSAIDLDNPPAGVQVTRQDGTTIVEIDQPAAGLWTARILGTGITVVQSFELRVFGQSPSLQVSAETNQDTYTFPEPMLISVLVSAGSPIVDCDVVLSVGHPDGSSTDLELFDDGLALHGDLVGGDGYYSNFLNQYSADGTYTFETRVTCTDGQFATYVLTDEPSQDPRPGGTVPNFERVVNFAALANNVPGGGGTALLPPGNLRDTTTTTESITLLWDDTNNGQTETVVQRSVGTPDNFQDLATVPAGTTSYTDPVGSTGTFFYRAIARLQGVGDSDPSNIVEVNMDAITAARAAAEQTGGAGSNPPPEFGSSGGFCFIATAAYGSYLDPHVMVLRNFRDTCLLTNAPGRAFVAAYYEWSPPLAQIIAGSESLRFIARVALTPVVLAVEYPWIALGLLAALSLLVRRLLLRRKLQAA